MSYGRTGIRSRFLFVPATGSRLASVFLALFLVFVVLSIAGVLGALALHGAELALSPTSVLRRLSAGGAGARYAGHEPVAGSFTGFAEPPVCNVEHEHYVSGKNGGWRVDQIFWLADGATFHTDDGRAWEVDRLALRFDPPDKRVADASLESTFRERTSGMYEGGRVVSVCARTGERLFLDACLIEGTQRLGRCADGDPSTITLGDGSARRRVRSHASDAAAQLAVGLGLLAAIALYLRHAARAGALVAALRAWSDAPPAPSRKRAYVGLGLGALAVWGALLLRVITAEGGSPYVAGYALGASAIAGALAAALHLWDRRALLALAMQPAERAETVRLARVGDGPAELAVRVRNDAPTVTLADGSAHAYVRVSVTRMVQAGRNVVAVPLRTASWPARVPVEDPTGNGVLDLTGADIDLRARSRALSGAAAEALLQAYARTPFGGFAASASPYVALVVEESFVDPGEHLYVLGKVARIEDPDAQSTYRDMATVPVVGSPDPARLVVFAGDERALLSRLAREKNVAAAAAYGLVAASGALLALLIYLRALA